MNNKYLARVQIKSTHQRVTFSKRNLFYPIPINVVEQSSQHLTVFIWYVFTCKLIPSTFIFTNPLNLWLNPNFLQDTCKTIVDSTPLQLKGDHKDMKNALQDAHKLT